MMGHGIARCGDEALRFVPCAIGSERVQECLGRPMRNLKNRAVRLVAEAPMHPRGLVAVY